MADEAIKTYATTINHVVDGAAIATAAMSVAGSIDTLVTSANSYNYPFADIILTVQYDSAPTAGEVVYLYRRDDDIVSTNDSADPSLSYKHKLVGVFHLVATTATQYHMVAGVELTKACAFFIYNGSSTGIGADDWDLDVRPWTYVPAA